MPQLKLRSTTSAPAWFRHKRHRYYLCSSRALRPICCLHAASGWQKARERTTHCCARRTARQGEETVCQRWPPVPIQRGRTLAARPPVPTTPISQGSARRSDPAKTPPDNRFTVDEPTPASWLYSAVVRPQEE